MKSYLKIGLIGAAILAVLILFTDYVKNKGDYKDLKKALAEKEQEVKTVNDNNIKLKDRVVSYEASKIVYEKEKDSIAKLLNVKPKTIKQYVSVNSGIDANLETGVDTVYRPGETKVIDSLTFDYKDEFIQAKGSVTPNKVRININGEDSLLFTYLNNGTVDIRNTNKYIKLKGASSLTIAPKEESTIDVRPFFGAAYVPFGNKKIEPVVGIGVTVNVKKVLKSIF